MTINYSNIETLEDIRVLSDVITKGQITMPNISRLARQLNRDRKTVKKAISGFVSSKRRKRSKYLDEYRSIIIDLLKDDNREFDYYQHLYNYLKREHKINCSYSTLKSYLINDEQLSKHFKKAKSNIKFTERFETEAGKQVQFDLKEIVPIIFTDGSRDYLNVATLTFGFSRKNIRKIVPDTSYETIISFLAESFDEIGGAPKEIVIDNIKCLVNKPRRAGKAAELNIKFEQFLKDYDMNVFACMPARPQTKGKTETQNKVPGQLKNYNGQYKDISDVNTILKVINDEDNNTISQATNLPPNFLFKIEKEKLAPLPNGIIRKEYYLKLKKVIVSNESLIPYNAKRYSLPKEYIGKTVGRTIKNNKLYIYYNNNLIAIHYISDKVINIKQSHNLKYPSSTKTVIVDEQMELEMGGIIYDNYE